MNKLSLILITIFFLSFTSDNNHFATVEKVLNTPIFLFSKPVSEYSIVGKAMSFTDMLKMAADQKSSVREKAKKIVQTAQKRVKDKKLSAFDALIIELENDKVFAIKFKSNISTKAKINNYGDLPVYFFCKPDEEYDVVAKLKADYSLRAERSGMLFDKINSMVKRTIKKKENNEVDNFDAIIISPDDLSEVLINFKK